MSNRRKQMRMKLPKPTLEQAQQRIAEATGVNDAKPGWLTRRQLRSMRRRVPVINVLDMIEAHDKEHHHA